MNLAATAFEGPEAPLTTGLIPLLLVCGLLIWIVLARPGHDRTNDDPPVDNWDAEARAAARRDHPARGNRP